MSAENFFVFEQTRNYVTERLTKPRREQQIKSLEKKVRNRTVGPYQAIYLDKLIPVSQDCPCISNREINKSIKEYYDRVYDRPNAKPLRL